MVKKIFHITPHLGGGVGRVLSNWLQFDTQNSHSVATLHYANKTATTFFSKNGLKLFPQPSLAALLRHVEQADIVLIHFWNHPLLYDFLVRTTLPAARVAIWSHISGLTPPQTITKKISNYPDQFVFTSPISFNFVAPENKYKAILSTGGTKSVQHLRPASHPGFNVGYIGTVDFSKMHPLYMDVHSKIKNVDRFIIVGGPCENEISKKAEARFVFSGPVADIRPYLAQMDVFAYLLNPNHYGTAEQALQEAMAAGVVPVVLNNLCEASLVKHFETGLVANTLDDYIKYVELLGKDDLLRKKLAKNAKRYARNNFSLSTLAVAWHNIFEEMIKKEKTARAWPIEKENITCYDVFMESLGAHSEIFTNNSARELAKIMSKSTWTPATKGTPAHYLQFFTDENLSRITNF